MEYSNIPTNRNEKTELGLKKIYATKDFVDSLHTLEVCKIIQKENRINYSGYYWFNNSAWNKNEPIGLISHEDAIEEDKPGCAFIYFDDTIPAFKKSDFPQYN